MVEWRRAAREVGVKSERHPGRKETAGAGVREGWLLIRPGDRGHMQVSGDFSQGLVVE